MPGHLQTLVYDQPVFDEVRNELLSGPRRLLEEGVLCKNGSRGYAAKISLAGRCFFLKQYYAKTGIYRCIDFFRGSRGRRTWKTNIRMFEAGVAVPKPIAYLEERTCGVWRNGYLLTEFIEGAGDLRKVWMQSDSRHREELVDCAGHLVAGLHRRGFVHGDLKWNNILCGPAGERWFLVLTDLDGAHRCHLLKNRGMAADLARFMADFAQVGADESSGRRFLAAYKAVEIQ